LARTSMLVGARMHFWRSGLPTHDKGHVDLIMKRTGGAARMC